MAIKLSRAASNDLLSIFLHGIERYGVKKAEQYKARLEHSFQILSAHPEIARLRDEISPPVRILPVQKHIIVYTLLDDNTTVFVLRIRHHRENWIESPIDGVDKSDGE